MEIDEIIAKSKKTRMKIAGSKIKFRAQAGFGSIRSLNYFWFQIYTGIRVLCVVKLSPVLFYLARTICPLFVINMLILI